jgi:hypothetical protein
VNILSLVLDRAGLLFAKGITAFNYNNALQCFVELVPQAREHSTILNEKFKTLKSKSSIRDTKTGFSAKVLLPKTEISQPSVSKKFSSFDPTVMFNDASSDVQFTQQPDMPSMSDDSEPLYPQSYDFMLDDDSSTGSDEDYNFGEISKSLLNVLQETEVEQQERIVSRLPLPKSLKKSAIYNASCFQTGEIDILLVLATQCYVIIETKRSTTKHSLVVARKQAVKYCRVFEILRPEAAIIGIAANYNNIGVVFDNGVSNTVTPLLQDLFQLLEHERSKHLKSKK